MMKLTLLVTLSVTVLAADVSSFLKVVKEKPLAGQAIDERSEGNLARSLENKLVDDRGEVASFLKVVKDKPLSEDVLDLINKRRAQERFERTLSARNNDRSTDVSSFLKVVKDKPLTEKAHDGLPLDMKRAITKTSKETLGATDGLASKKHFIDFSNDENRRLDFDGIKCGPLDDEELVCYGDDIPNGGLVTVFICPASAVTVEDCRQQCYIFMVDEADQITTSTPACNDCSVCTADTRSQLSFDCSNLSADPCAVQDCSGSDCLLLAPGLPGGPNSGGASGRTVVWLMSVVGAGVGLLFFA